MPTVLHASSNRKSHICSNFPLAKKVRWVMSEGVEKNKNFSTLKSFWALPLFTQIQWMERKLGAGWSWDLKKKHAEKGGGGLKWQTSFDRKIESCTKPHFLKKHQAWRHSPWLSGPFFFLAVRDIKSEGLLHLPVAAASPCCFWRLQWATNNSSTCNLEAFPGRSVKTKIYIYLVKQISGMEVLLTPALINTLLRGLTSK